MKIKFLLLRIHLKATFFFFFSTGFFWEQITHLKWGKTVIYPELGNS